MQSRCFTLASVAAALFLLLNGCNKPPPKEGAAASSVASSASAAQPSSNATSTTPAGSSADVASASATPPSQNVASGDNSSQLVDIGSVTVDVDPGANNGAPIAVDLVFVYDVTMLAQISTETAATWFKAKEALTATAGGAISIMSWTIMAGEEVPETPVDVPPGAIAAFLFSNYASAGDHRQRIDGAGTLAITLGTDDASVEVDQ